MKSKFAVSLMVAAVSSLASSYALAVPQIMAGDTIKLETKYADGTAKAAVNGGGEFKASALTGNSPSFQTFCIEYNEHFTPGQTLYVKAVNTGAVNGGSGGQPIGTPNFDPIGFDTAYLFTKFSQGTLSGYDYGTSTPAARAAHLADSTSLQLAIWKLEGEISSTANNSVYNLYLADSQAQTWVTEAQGSGWTSIRNVRALNLYTSADFRDSSKSQDQLYLTPVPEPETYAMMLAGLGMIGFVAGKRRRKFA